MARSKSQSGLDNEASTLSLPAHSVETIHNVAYPYCIDVVEGTAYVTREGDATDYVVRADSCLRIDGPGAVVVEGFPDARLKISA
jgi:hypothetical protein